MDSNDDNGSTFYVTSFGTMGQRERLFIISWQVGRFTLWYKTYAAAKGTRTWTDEMVVKKITKPMKTLGFRNYGFHELNNFKITNIKVSSFKWDKNVFPFNAAILKYANVYHDTYINTRKKLHGFSSDTWLDEMLLKYIFWCYTEV